MADEGPVIRGIDWRATFPFTHIFRSFAIARHPSKLVLGMALLLTVYFGGRILDWRWPKNSRAVPGEVTAYENFSSTSQRDALPGWIDRQRLAIEEDYAQKLLQYKVITPGKNEPDESTRQRALSAAQKGDLLDELRNAIIKHRDNDLIKAAHNAHDDAYKAAKAAFDAKPDAPGAKDVQAKSQSDADTQLNTEIAAAYDAAYAEIRNAEQIEGEGLFRTFFEYETSQVNDVVTAVTQNNWLGPDGVSKHVQNFFLVGPVWLAWHHWVFFILFAILFLAAWALFGGAISRIAAVQIARDEKISVREAMNFAVEKLLSFVSAPVIPIVIIIGLGLILTAAGFVGGLVPFVGPIAIGVLFILALMVGVVMTLLLLGMAGGFNLMYPTIAVEGSDSFDAISRSYSYVYHRPWRLLFYTAIAIGYGAATYMFVHIFIWTTLTLTHHFMQLGVWRDSENTRNLFAVMWPAPSSTGRLTYHIDWSALTFGQSVGAFCIQAWVMLLVSLLGAFAISLYFSANSVIYYLMRVEVDSTEMDDVYMEPSEDELEPLMASAVQAQASASGIGSPVIVTVATVATAVSADAPTVSPDSANPTPPPSTT